VVEEIIVHTYDTTCYQVPVTYGNRTLIKSETVRDTFSSVHGCDSIAVFHLYMREQVIN